jgi:hypothetical protein
VQQRHKEAEARTGEQGPRTAGMRPR